MNAWTTRRMIFLLPLTMGLCWVGAFAQGESARSRLESFVSFYKDGEYQRTADSLQTLIPLLADSADLIEGYKYLGFSFGMLNWIDKSKEVFKTAMEKYPDMDIDTLEVPPNITLIFKQAKLEKKIEKIDTLKTLSPRIIVQKKNVLAPVLLLSAGIVTAAASADLFYYGNQEYQKYKSFSSPDQGQLDRLYANFRNSVIAGAAGAALTAVLVPYSIHLFVKKDGGKKSISVSIVKGAPSLVWEFIVPSGS
jgi:hypothetical protein